MAVLVTGAGGYIGRHVVQQLLKKNIDLILMVREESSIPESWKLHQRIKFWNADLNHISDITVPIETDRVIHLAWSGLPHYKKLYHFEENLMPQYFFIKKLAESGVKDITIAGTCLEYGLQEGALDAYCKTDPIVPYAIAKDSLRKFCFQLNQSIPFHLKWLRLFYSYGEGQSSHSILSQLAQALERGDSTFNMSPGDQMRDYLPISEMADQIIASSLKDHLSGIFNCCSGNPISINQLVENFLKQNQQTIHLNRAYYSYPDYEPHAFWGIPNIPLN